MKIYLHKNNNKVFSNAAFEMKVGLLKKIALLLICVASLNLLNVAAHGDEHEAKPNPLFSGVDTEAGMVIKQFHQALQKGDEKLIKSLLADDVLIYEGGGIERSAAEYASHHLKADIKYLSGLTVKLLEHQVKVSENMAYSTSRSLMTGEYQGKNVKTQTMETILLTKTNGNWLISHIHWSN